jgi:hypothetical protein
VTFRTGIGRHASPALPAYASILKFPAFRARLAFLARPARLAPLALLAATALTGCGYQFQVEGPGPVIGGDAYAQPTKLAGKPAPRIRITNFENKAFEPNLEIKYTTYTRHEFSAGSGAIVVPQSAPADLILKGQIVSVAVPSISFLPTSTLESRVSVIVKAYVEDVKTGKVVWDRLASATAEFFVTNDLQFNRVLQTRALEQAGRLIAEDLATQFLNYLEAGPEPPKAGSGIQPVLTPTPQPTENQPDKGLSGR